MYQGLPCELLCISLVPYMILLCALPFKNHFKRLLAGFSSVFLQNFLEKLSEIVWAFLGATDTHGLRSLMSKAMTSGNR